MPVHGSIRDGVKIALGSSEFFAIAIMSVRRYRHCGLRKLPLHITKPDLAIAFRPITVVV